MKAKKPANGRSFTLTLEQCLDIFRSYGIPMDKKRLSEGIKAGVYPGRVLSVGPTGRTSFEIWRKDVEAFLADRAPSPTPPYPTTTT
jgi:hypothetical protein